MKRMFDKTKIHENDMHARISFFAGVLLLAMVITSMFYSFVKETVLNRIYPDREIQITIVPEENDVPGKIYLYNFLSDEELWNAVSMAEKSEAWSYVYANGTTQAFEAYLLDESLTINFSRQLYKYEYLDFSSPDESVNIIVSINGRADEYIIKGTDCAVDLVNESLEKTVLVINCMAFGCVMLLVFVLILLAIYFVVNVPFENTFLGKEYGLATFAILTLFFLIWGYIAFAVGIEEYISCYGDQAFYWSEGNRLNPFIQARELSLPHRGYLSPWLCTICIRLGNLMHVKGEIFWILFLSVVHGAIFGYVLPRIYILLGNKNKPILIQMLVLAVVYAWGPFGYQIMGKLGDAPGLFFFLFSVWALLEVKEKGSKYCFFSGAFISVAISYRMTYKHALYFGLFIALAMMILGAIKKQMNIKKSLKEISLFCLGLVLVSIPQLYGNLYNGVFSLFPYTYEGSQQALSTSAWGLQVGVLVFGYPYGAIDPSFVNMATRTGLMNYHEGYSVITVLSTLSGQWLDTIIYIFKKLFFGFSPVREISYKSIITGYPNSFPFKHDSSFTIIPTVNYIFMGITGYMLFAKKRLLTHREIIGFIGIFLSLLLPQTFTHVEWRYFLPGYFIIYYMVFFKLFDVSRNAVKNHSREHCLEEIGRMLSFASIYVVASEALLWSFY